MENTLIQDVLRNRLQKQVVKQAPIMHIDMCTCQLFLERIGKYSDPI